MLKYLIRFILPVLITCMYTTLSAQQTVTWTEDFNNLGCNTLGGCSNNGHSQSVITPTCLPGGGTSHGTPHISNSTGGIQSVWMGANVEGIFLGFPFQAGTQYAITIRVRVGSAGNVSMPIADMSAANGIVHNVDCYSGSAPAVNDRQSIAMVDVSSAIGSWSDWTDFTVKFCPDADYDQFWIFPRGNNFVLNLDEVNIEYEECDPSVIYTSSIPSFYQTNGTIRTISSFFTVANNPNVVSNLLAGDFILFSPKTLVYANGTGDLLARITPCVAASCSTGGSSLTSGGTYGGGGLARGTGRREAAENGVEKQELIAYPNPANTQFRIKLSGADQATLVKLRIMDAMGRVVFQHANYSFNDAVSTGRMSNGMYTVTVLLDGVVYTQKMVVRH